MNYDRWYELCYVVSNTSEQENVLQYIVMYWLNQILLENLLYNIFLLMIRGLIFDLWKRYFLYVSDSVVIFSLIIFKISPSKWYSHIWLILQSTKIISWLYMRIRLIECFQIWNADIFSFERVWVYLGS